MMYRVRGAILIGIFLVSIISWPRSTSVTLFPHTDKGDSAFNFFKSVVAFKPLRKMGNVIDVSAHPAPKDFFIDRSHSSALMEMEGYGTLWSPCSTWIFLVSGKMIFPEVTSHARCL